MTQTSGEFYSHRPKIKKENKNYVWELLQI